MYITLVGFKLRQTNSYWTKGQSGSFPSKGSPEITTGQILNYITFQTTCET